LPAGAGMKVSACLYMNVNFGLLVWWHTWNILEFILQNVLDMPIFVKIMISALRV